jgi:signal transduction histidine kinase
MARAQTPVIDSLRAAIASERDVERKILLFDKLDNQLPNPNDKLRYAREAYRYIDEATPKSQITLASNMGVAHGMLGQLDSSEFYFTKSLEASLATRDSAQISTGYNGMGNIHRIKGNLETSLSYFLKALDYADAMPRKTWKGDVLTNIGGLYYDLQDYEACKEMVVQAHQIFVQNSDTFNISYSLTLMAIVHRSLHDLDAAYTYNQEALELLRITNDTTQIIYNLITTSSILLDQKRYAEATKTLNNVIEMARRFGERDPEITGLLSLSRIHFVQGRIAQADKLVDDAIRVSNQYNFRNTLPMAYTMKSLMLAANGKYEEAFAMTERSKLSNDSIRSKEISARAKDLQLKYESDKKENEISRLNAEQSVKDLKLKQAQTVNFLLATLASSVLIALIIFLYSYRQRSRINAQLVMANQTKDKLLSIIAHDIKNPLSAMQGLAGLLEEDHKKMDPDQLALVISTMNTSSNKLYELLQNLLEWSITEAGGLAFEPKKLKPTKIVIEAVELFKGAIEAKRLIVTNGISEDVRVHADYKMLFSVVRNLLSNAIKFTPAGGTIHFGCEMVQGMCEIRVQDSGVGIAEDRLPKLFDRAYSKSKNGTGLGLVLCKEFVVRNGGTIRVESSHGSGTVFRFTMPAI